MAAFVKAQRKDLSFFEAPCNKYEDDCQNTENEKVFESEKGM